MRSGACVEVPRNPVSSNLRIANVLKQTTWIEVEIKADRSYRDDVNTSSTAVCRIGLIKAQQDRAEIMRNCNTEELTDDVSIIMAKLINDVRDVSR